MDNIFEILIYLIIIISFLSSIFKKRNQQQQKPPVQQPQQEDYYQDERAEVSTPQTQKKEDYDILSELEDFFKVGNELPEQDRTTTSKPERPVSIIQSKEKSESNEWHTPTASEHSYTNDWDRKRLEVKKILGSVDSAIEKKAAMFEESQAKKETSYSSIALALKSKMKTPSTLKDYIIFSEILGKPKALRR
jgi:hypothetical protein